MNFFKKKRGEIPYWLASLLVAVAVLVVLTIISFLFKEKLFSLVSQIKRVLLGT